MAQAGGDDLLAMRAYAYLTNGMGAFDWAGLPVVCALFDVTDPEALIGRLVVIKTHKTPAPDAQD
jgi:hypothetical protein